MLDCWKHLLRQQDIAVILCSLHVYRMCSHSPEAT